jgi:hypothetical protein
MINARRRFAVRTLTCRARRTKIQAQRACKFTSLFGAAPIRSMAYVGTFLIFTPKYA